MSRTKILIQLIECLEKPEFDEVVKTYLKEEYGFERIVNTDGKDDTGIDIKVFDFQKEKLQFQLTTQKSKTQVEKRSFDKKLKEDLEKAKTNNQEYGFGNKLFFFYSYELTNKVIREYEKLAFKDYGINLELIDANRLAEEAENIIAIQRVLYKKNKLDEFAIKESVFDNENENFIFDLLSFGKPSEFRKQIIEGFILKTIFDKNSLSTQEIKDYCESKFKVGENDVFYTKLLLRLQSSKKIRKESDGCFSLTEEEKNLISKKVEQYELDEKVFISEIHQILEPFNQGEHIDDYILQLKELYTQNFSSDLKDLLNAGENEAIFSVAREFIHFTNSKLDDKEKAKSLSLKLLRYCIDSKFIQKIAASKVYCSNINNSRLERYLNTQKRIFVDTPVALYALCYFYKPKSDYNNYFYSTTKGLIEFSSHENLNLHISERYIWEVQNHVKEAFYLIPFSQLDNFRKLGSSKNVFYNFYLFLLNNDLIDDQTTFNEFLSEYGLEESSSQDSINSKICSHLAKMNIHKYEFEYEYDIEDTNRIFENILIANNKFKSPFTRNNDSIMVKFLADNDVDVHPVQPVFLTWDRSFFDVQKQYFKSYPDCQKWIMLPPGKMIDSYAVLKFKIDSESVTENLLALISDELILNTHALVDTIKFILDPNNEVSLEYTNRLAQIREEEIDRINRKVSTPPEEFEGEAVIDEVFYSLSNHFQEKEDEKYFGYFREIFTKKELMATVIDSIMSAIESYYQKQKIDSKLFTTFDKLVEEIKKEKSA